MPNDVTPEDIANAYLWGWELGLKAIAIYRDGSKQSQPLSTKVEGKKGAAAATKPGRERLPDTRNSVTHKFNVGGHEGYINVGLYPDGRPGEVFITMAKEGSTVGGLMDSFGTAISIALQYGVPLDVLVYKFSHTRFEPMGHTTNPEIRTARSVVDYIFRWLGLTFLPGFRESQSGSGRTESDGETRPTEGKKTKLSASPRLWKGCCRQHQERTDRSQSLAARWARSRPTPPLAQTAVASPTGMQPATSAPTVVKATVAAEKRRCS
jgi:ribonucleoside-diphosphate reductase alpha chain